ncbi:MAG: signal recognition particle-docking protein FtsY [Desulfuromonadaceae bacterium]|nr:signal recognition particle-docking protein FtsY [Desulfuromonas sp.]MDY0184355.1 signal recognition particle-docking protein FtsY [Desulfuromonadaceae bacterium]
MDITQSMEKLYSFAQEQMQHIVSGWRGFILWLRHQFAAFAEVLEHWGVPVDKSLSLAYTLAYISLVLVLVFCVWRLARISRSRKGDVAHRATCPTVEVSAQEHDGKPDTPEVSAEFPAVREQPISVYERMRNGLAKTHKSLFGKLDAVLGSGAKINSATIEEIEEILVSADFGVRTTQKLVTALQERLTRGEMQQAEQVRTALREEILAILSSTVYTADMEAHKPYVMMVVGVNGVGKTTTVGKLAHQLKQQGQKVILGAADTFRAAAAEQLVAWGERADVGVVRHSEGADPAAVAFDAAKAAIAREADLLIVDTAGRLHTKVNLMEEMKKIRRVLEREISGAPHETLLVLDATTGQNALTQARLFREAVAIDGIILTKLDGTARGGMAVAIASELHLPVRYIGVGEGVEDLRPFEPELFVDALFESR